MGKTVERETYRFFGDSSSNVAKQIENGEAVVTTSQTRIIQALNENKQYIVSGKKIYSPVGSKRQAYVISYGKDKEHVDEIITIVVDKDALEKGDPNALAIDGLCQSAIKVKMKNTAIKLVAGATIVLMMAGLAYGAVTAMEKEDEYNKQKMESYFEQIDEERAENGLAPLTAEYEFDFNGYEEHTRGGR